MNKFAVIASLFGLYKCTTVMERTDSGSILENDWLNLNWRYRFDITYGTLYRGAAPTETSAPYDREEYGGFLEDFNRLYIEGDYAKIR